MTSRTQPVSVTSDLAKSTQSNAFLAFLTITHDLLVEPVRVVADPTDHVLDGETFTGFMFDVRLLSDTDRPPEASLSIQNVDRRLTQALRRAIEPAKLKLEIISSDQFDLSADPRTELVGGASSRMYEADELCLRNVRVTTLFITGTLATWDYTQEIYPGLVATKDRLPGLFR